MTIQVDQYNYTASIDDGNERVYHTVMSDFNMSLCQTNVMYNTTTLHH